MKTISVGFLMEPLMLPIDGILPSRTNPTGLIDSHKFKQIRDSINAIGLIEPLSVALVGDKSGKHLLLDGHNRLIAMRELGYLEVACLVAKDDESYTYNNRINRLSAVQEHLMIRRAIERGVSEESLGAALCVDPGRIRKKLHLLDGICPQVIELLKDRQFLPEVLGALRKMKPQRQFECAELMSTACNFTIIFARALLTATNAEELVSGAKSHKAIGADKEQIARMDAEMTRMRGQYKLAEETFSEDVLNLVLARGYLGKLLSNENVSEYLSRHQIDVLEEFTTIVRSTSMDM